MSPRRPVPTGFVRGDFDPAFPLDDKVMQLRATTTPDDYYRAMGVYWHVVAAAWRKPERVPGERTVPDCPDGLADLVRVGLLDRAGRLTVPAFTGWIGKALASRASATERKARNRTGMSRVTDAGQTVTAPSPREGEEGEVITTPEGTEGGVGETQPDAAVSLHQRTGAFPSEKILSWLNELADQHGEARLAAVIDGEPLRGRNVRDYLVAVRDRLRLEDHAADKAERQAERVKVAEQRRVNVPLLRSYHNNGAHVDAPHPRCPLCSEDAA